MHRRIFHSSVDLYIYFGEHGSSNHLCKAEIASVNFMINSLVLATHCDHDGNHLEVQVLSWLDLPEPKFAFTGNLSLMRLDSYSMYSCSLSHYNYKSVFLYNKYC